MSMYVGLASTAGSDRRNHLINEKTFAESGPNLPLIMPFWCRTED